jgi:hypothetical protein
MDLVVAIRNLAPSLGQEAIYLGKRLYDCQYSEADPAIIPVEDQHAITNLQKVCKDAGIILEIS